MLLRFARGAGGPGAARVELARGNQHHLFKMSRLLSSQKQPESSKHTGKPTVNFFL
jgi:hypothetical protein